MSVISDSLPEPHRVASASSYSALVALAIIMFAFFFAASTPSPLFVKLQKEWAFSSGLLTLAFSIYALTLLGALLVAGSLSDHLGRRPVICFALVLETIAMLLFIDAQSITGLIWARALQGIATGIASGALPAAIVEAAPSGRKQFGALVSSVMPLAGLSTGALVAGVALTTLVHPKPWLFTLLTVIFPLFILLLWRMPETSALRAGVIPSMVPRVYIAPQVRANFWRSMPSLLATWALCGLYLALAPSRLLGIHAESGDLLNGSTISLLCGAGAIAPIALRSVSVRVQLVSAPLTIAAGSVFLLLALSLHSLGVFVLGTALAGAAMGAAFSSVVQLLAPHVDEHERAELFAALFIASYLSLSLPPIVAGYAVAHFGLAETVNGYLMSLVVVSFAGAGWQALRANSSVMAEAKS